MSTPSAVFQRVTFNRPPSRRASTSAADFSRLTYSTTAFQRVDLRSLRLTRVRRVNAACPQSGRRVRAKIRHINGKRRRRVEKNDYIPPTHRPYVFGLSSRPGLHTCNKLYIYSPSRERVLPRLAGPAFIAIVVTYSYPVHTHHQNALLLILRP